MLSWYWLIFLNISGSIQSKASGTSETLTERDYLAIGVCAGFLVMLYIFAIIVFIVIKKKQRRDKRSREQFLRLPIPQGIGFKSSRLVGLEEKYLSDFARLSADNRCSKRHKNLHNCELHNKLSHSQGHFGFAKKFKSNRKTSKQVMLEHWVNRIINIVHVADCPVRFRFRWKYNCSC
jgi:hypothetical protein